MINQNLLISNRAAVVDDIENQITHIAVGDDDTDPTSIQTALFNETFRDATDEYDKSVTGRIITSLRIGTTDNNGEVIREVGGFKAASAGDMQIRRLITAINKTDDIQVFVDLVFDITINEEDVYSGG